jgi:Sensors of blue-light using FAD
VSAAAFNAGQIVPGASVLEGPGADFERLYETLNHDPRHKDLLLLLNEPLAARQFSDWSVAHIGPNQWAKQAAGPPSREHAGARRLLTLKALSERRKAIASEPLPSPYRIAVQANGNRGGRPTPEKVARW